MVAINNLKGHIIQDGRVIYSEEIAPKVIFAVIEQYESIYEKANFVSSSRIWLEATITTGEKHTWSNGVISLIENEEQEVCEVEKEYKKLQRLKTKDGYNVWQSSYNENRFKLPNGTDMKSRKIKWIVEVPKDKLASYFTK